MGTPVRLASVKDGDLATPMPLNAFMTELGVVMQLPRKKTTQAMPVVPEVLREVRRGSAIVLPTIAVLLALVAVWTNVEPRDVPRELPAALRGEWATVHPQYRERRLSFTANEVGIALREGSAPALHPVRAVTSQQRGDTTRLTIGYDDNGAPQDFRVVLVSGAGARPTIELSNPPGVYWVPAREASSPQPVLAK